MKATDAREILEVCQAVDGREFSGRGALARSTLIEPSNLRVAIPKAGNLEFFGNVNAKLLFQKGIETLSLLGHEIHEIDFEIFLKQVR